MGAQRPPRLVIGLSLSGYRDYPRQETNCSAYGRGIEGETRRLDGTHPLPASSGRHGDTFLIGVVPAWLPFDALASGRLGDSPTAFEGNEAGCRFRRCEPQQSGRGGTSLPGQVH